MKSKPALNLLLGAALSFGTAVAVILTDPHQLQQKEFDYVIVGAGTAGLALASRLTEDTDATVLVLEAGVSDANVFQIQAPFLAPSVTPDTPYDWNYTVVPQKGMDNRTFAYPRGRVLGGSSSANYMIHQYGSNENWDRIAKVTGDSGWGWDNMRQYILRHERFVIPPHDGHNATDQYIPDLHSYIGAVDVSLYGYEQYTDKLVIETTKQLKEFPYNEEMSGINNNMLGIGWAQSSMGGGDRVSSSTSYLKMANERPNFTVLINAMVTKLLPTGERDGLKSFRRVEFADGRIRSLFKLFWVNARREVILSAGAIGSVQILQLSGIGDPADLNPLGIPVLINSPQVGKNLQDHPLTPNVYVVKGNESLDHILRNATAMGAAINEWRTKKSGFVSNNVVNNLGFARLKASLLEGWDDPGPGKKNPHYELIFANYWLDPGAPLPPTGSYFTILTALLTPTSRGTVKINSTNPFDAPLIDPNMLTTDWDVHVMRESVKAAKRFAEAPVWKDYIIGSVGKLFSSSDKGIDAHARGAATTIFHPTSSASMSSYTSSKGVVNPDLVVKGTEGLRIVDLSVLPYIPSCHPQGAAYMIAERAADLIKYVMMSSTEDLNPQYIVSY